jgi:carbamoyl-phosphate synthase/aspartate carbamoyltransferase/dihydroorotase
VSQTITLPGLIDPHVHLRDPGQTHKEDLFEPVPAPPWPVATPQFLICPITSSLSRPKPGWRISWRSPKPGFAAMSASTLAPWAITLMSSPERARSTWPDSRSTLNVTTGGFVIDQAKLIEIYRAWPSTKPILLHAEDDVLHLMLDAVRETKKTTHVCHVSSRAELEFVLQAKEEGLPVSCGACPHHLFSDGARTSSGLGSHAIMKPALKSQADQDFSVGSSGRHRHY